MGRVACTVSVMALVLGLLAGCGGDDTPAEVPGGGGGAPASPVSSISPVSPDPPVSTPPPRTVVHMVGPEKCPSPHSTPAPIRASAEVEFKVRALTLCMTPDGARTYLKNESSSLVWTIDQPPGLSWRPTSDPLPIRVDLFRSARGPSSAGLPLEPGRAVTLDYPPARLHVFTDAGNQAAWETVSDLVDEAVGVGGDLAVDRLSRNSPERKAVLTCAFNAFQVGSGIKDAAGDPALQLNAALGLAEDVTTSSADCVSEVREAERARVAQREAPLLEVRSTKARFNSAGVVAKTNQTMRQSLVRIGRLVFS